MAPLLVVSGPPGAGKSAVSDVLVQRFPRGALVAGDVFFAFLRRGAIEPWRPEAHAQNEVVVRAAAAAAGQLARGGLTVVYDGVIDPVFVATFAAATGADDVHYAVVLPPLVVCLERVRTRVGHGFTDLDAARHMYDRFAGARLPERYVLADPVGDPAAVADLIAARLAAGALRVPVGAEAEIEVDPGH